MELKDNKSDFPKATKQVISTYDAFKRKLATPFQSKYIAKAFICCSKGSLPQEYKTSLNELNKKFNACVHDGKPEDFLDFLRGEDVKFNKRGQKKK